MITILNPPSHQNEDGHYQFKLFYERFGLPTAIVLTSPPFFTQKSAEEHLEGCKRDILLANLDWLYMNAKDTSQPAPKKLLSGTRYFHEKKLPLKDMCKLVVQMENLLKQFCPADKVNTLITFAKQEIQ